MACRFMPLDEAGRKKRATKAGKASGEKRTDETWKRDHEIYRAYIYLSKESPQEKWDVKLAREFLEAHGISAKIKKDDPEPYRKLADATGLTRQRIYQIIKKKKLKKIKAT